MSFQNRPGSSFLSWMAVASASFIATVAISAQTATVSVSGQTQVAERVPILPLPTESNGAGMVRSWQASVRCGTHAQVNLATGNLMVDVPLSHHFGEGRGPAIDFVLYHNSNAVSKVGDFAGGAGFGAGWSHAYGGKLEIKSATKILVTSGDGTEAEFKKINGEWVSPAGFFQTLELQTNGSWTLTEKDQRKRTFASVGGAYLPVSIQDASGNAISILYQGQQVSQVVDASGRSVSFTYSGGRLDRIADYFGETLFHYDAQGRLDLITDPKLLTVQLSYESNGKVKAVTDRDGNAWSFEYGANGRLTKSSDPASIGTSESFAYQFINGFHEVNGIDRRGHTWIYRFDAALRLVQITDPLGNSRKFTYNGKNCLTISENEVGKKWLFTYDNRGNCLSAKDPLGRTAMWTYDSLNNVTSRKDGLGNVVSYFYEDPNHPTFRTSTEQPADGQGNSEAITTFEYFGPQFTPPGMATGAWNGKLARVVDANGVETKYTYDDLGQHATLEEGPSGWPFTVGKQFNVSPGGFVYSSTEIPGVGGVTGPGFPQIPALPSAISWPLSYQATGNSTWSSETQDITHFISSPIGPVSFASRSKTYQYDALGRLTQFDLTTDESGFLISRQFNYSYDDSTGTTLVVGPDGGTTTLVLNSIDKVESLTKDTGMSVTFTYYSDRKVQTATYGNGTQVRYVYFDNDLVKDIIYETTAGALIFSMSYGYDSRNLPTSVLEMDAGGFVASVALSYDNRGQLISEARVGNDAYSLEYSYDQVGNRLTKTDPISGFETVYHYDVHAAADGFATDAYGSFNNRVMFSQQFDNGSLLSTTWYYYEPQFGNISSVVTKATSDPELRGVRFVYAGNGTLWLAIEEKWNQGAGGVPTNVERLNVREFRQDGLSQRYLARSLSPSDFAELPGATYSDYFQVGDELAMTPLYGDYTVSASGVVSQGREYLQGAAERDAVSGTTLYSVFDNIGNARLTTDDLGSAIGLRVSSAFGESVSQPSPSLTLGFSGAQGAEEGLLGFSVGGSDLVHMGARYYLPGVGRFLMRDPIGIRGDLNVYAYANNAPTYQTDPTGLWAVPQDFCRGPATPTPPSNTCPTCGGDNSNAEMRAAIKKILAKMEEEEAEKYKPKAFVTTGAKVATPFSGVTGSEAWVETTVTTQVPLPSTPTAPSNPPAPGGWANPTSGAGPRVLWR